MFEHRWWLLLSAALAALAVMCEKEVPPTAPPGPQPTGIPLPTTMTACAYTTVGGDTLAIVAPAQLMCDSAGAPVQLPQQTVRTWYRASEDSFEVSLKNVSPIIRRIMAGPSFSSEVAGFLDMLDTTDTGPISVTGVFLRLEGSGGMQGLWRFSGLKPPFIEQLLSPVQKATLNSMIMDPEAKASMMFRFRADTLWGLLSRRTYGDAVLAGQLDTVTYSVRAVFAGDSAWRVIGLTSADTAGVTVNGDGDLSWSWGDSTHVYRQFPAQCPNPVTPSWFGLFLAPNRR